MCTVLESMLRWQCTQVIGDVQTGKERLGTVGRVVICTEGAHHRAPRKHGHKHTNSHIHLFAIRWLHIKESKRALLVKAGSAPSLNTAAVLHAPITDQIKTKQTNKQGEGNTGERGKGS